MASSKETIAHLLDQLDPLPVRVRPMFGEYCLYCDEKVVALICDDILYVKPTLISEELFLDPELSPPYPGAKNYVVVPEERLEDRAWLQDLVLRTAAVLPVPRKKSRPSRS